MNNDQQGEMQVGAMKSLHAADELSTGIGSFYTEPGLPSPPSAAVRCDCLACREQELIERFFRREPT
jgi:hypothetical protein